MRAYHFLSADFALQSLIKRRLKIARLSDLNDPFELLSGELSTPEYRRAFSGFKADMSEKYGVVCFSRKWSNPVLWSHYGDRHKGICLGFDISDELVRPVTYTGKRLQLRIERKLKKGSLDDATMDQILTTKFEDWKYEDEVRIVLSLGERDGETGSYFKEYCDELRIRQVILGPRCIFTAREVTDILRGSKEEVEVIRARLAFKSFRVVKNKIATRKQL